MRKIFLITLTVLMMCSTALAAPKFVLMKFTDDTRYDLIESAESLSDLVMEKLIASGKFNLRETYPLDENIEAILYDEKMRELSRLETAFETGDFNPLFEGRGFDENKAQSIATAQGSKCIVRINEFRAEPDVNLLRLPEGLEDVTKR